MEQILLSKELNNYLLKLNKSQEELFPEMRKFAKKNKIPIIQPLTVNLLKILISILKPKKVLEIGTAIGYSSLIMASAMNQGKIITIELSSPSYEKAKAYFNKYSSLQKRNKVQIELIQGHALNELKKLSGYFDLIFIDARKDQYLDYYKLIKPLIKKGTVIIADNCLWKNQIHQNRAQIKMRNKILKQFNNLMFKNKSQITSLIPLDDGILISVAK